MIEIDSSYSKHTIDETIFELFHEHLHYSSTYPREGWTCEGVYAQFPKLAYTKNGIEYPGASNNKMGGATWYNYLREDGAVFEQICADPQNLSDISTRNSVRNFVLIFSKPYGKDYEFNGAYVCYQKELSSEQFASRFVRVGRAVRIYNNNIDQTVIVPDQEVIDKAASVINKLDYETRVFTKMKTESVLKNMHS